jgi:outer membrane protein OmpA-like peptidoglycan-associated protein
MEVIRARPKWKIELTGHTDERGSDEYNLQLSTQRVENVAAYLVKSGVVANRVTTKGEGKLKPLSSGKDEAAHAINRRVEITFVEE